MSATSARKLARLALGMAPAGGIREELRADLEAAEAEFARRLKDGEDFDTLMNEAEMDRKKGGGGGSGKKRNAPTKSHRTSDPIVEEPLSAGEDTQALQLVPHNSASLVPVMVQQLLAREQVALEQQKAALELERSKRRREQEEHELEMASKRLELAAKAKDKGLVDHLPLIFGGGGTAHQQETTTKAAAAPKQPPASPAKSGKAKEAAAESNQATAANKDKKKLERMQRMGLASL